MTDAYRVPMGGGGLETTEKLRARVTGGRPNWWVILAVSLALMALLVATATTTPGHLAPRKPVRATVAGGTHGATSSRTSTRAPGASSPASPTTTTTSPVAAVSSSALVVAPATDTVGTTTTTVPKPVSTSTVPTATTTTTQPASLPADRSETEGYLDPPAQTSGQYGFTGDGAMEISVVWSGSTYLTMTVSCPNGSQNVGGTSAMAASLPDAQGSCVATVSEPASESTSLTYTITIGPAGG